MDIVSDENYGIAYLDKNGRGFSNIEPWIFPDFNNLEECLEKSQEMVVHGFKNVMVFRFDEALEYYTWSEVKKRKVDCCQ